MKYLLVLLFPFLLFANLRYESNHNKELAILESFDIEPSFINDPVMNDMRNNKLNLSKKKKFFYSRMGGPALTIQTQLMQPRSNTEPIAKELAKKQKEICIAEVFERNKQK